ncbi:hypothetical protein HMPREF9318_01351 [Streptococcus urinalis FB127-CNA-2]|uniref:Uncharacterized protein n=1 Tax=Streptococcus urinalis 2285-97 TaxID=764291 RepID=G5KCT1_9STRE|nr:hypothetical protein STRUR_0528 [Streptococcus urinalis 2285-97]EKS19275.1 hypothetical protein HMPREF9318_01351 [Streptococcus urinalis FB127-CNA-2]VEF31406.1 response regulator of the competence regulon [Streptococcus urinalis]
MFNIFVLEDNFLQQTRLEELLLSIAKEKAITYKSLSLFGKPQSLIEAIKEKGSHQLFFFRY